MHYEVVDHVVFRENGDYTRLVPVEFVNPLHLAIIVGDVGSYGCFQNC